MRKYLLTLFIMALFLFIPNSAMAASHHIIFDAQGGTPSEIEELDLEDGEEFVVPAVTKEGYTFGGWYYVDDSIPLNPMNVQLEGNQVKNFWPATVTFFANWVVPVDEIAITIDAPIGTEVSLTNPISEEYVTVPEGAHYTANPEGAGLIKAYDNDDAFEGVIEEGKDYYIELWVQANGGKFNSNTNITVNGQKTFVGAAAYLNPDGSLTDWAIESGSILMYAKFTATSGGTNNKEYTINSENGVGTAIFNFATDHNFVLDITDILSLTNEQRLSKYNIEEKEFNKYLDIIKENVKQYGNLIALYDISINDGNLGYSDALKLKLKLTSLMKEYDSLKFVYLDENNNFAVGDVKDVLKNAETGDVDLDHLSVYALVGTKKAKIPKTGDNIVIYFSIFGLYIIRLATSKLYSRNKSFN